MLNLDHDTCNLSLNSLILLLLFDLEQESAVDVWQDTSEGNGGADQGIEFFVTTDGELQMARGNALDFEVLGSVLQKVLVHTTQIRKRGLTPASSRTSAVRYSSTAVT